ncbi:MAG: hypothetical protein Q4A12_02185, partial [Eubacteriales bacterium]|nr:hypothetical protein [Eubacteriales bacterium]
MSTTKKIVLAVAALVIVGLLVYAAVSGGHLGTVECMDCHGTGVAHDVDCPYCDEFEQDDNTYAGAVDCETCQGSGKTDDADCADCSGKGIVSKALPCEYCEGDNVIEKTSCGTCSGEGEVQGTLWALLPPFIAIGLALITKEVYSSLFIGIVTGGLIYSNFSFLGTVDTVINDGLITAVSGNAGIFIFLIELGVLVALVNKAGGSAAFGRWAAKHIKSKIGTLFATFILGVLIFIDDYFNCLTVGSVMRPVTDTHKISRSKLAYIIDATAAPVCMIAPI